MNSIRNLTPRCVALLLGAMLAWLGGCQSTPPVESAAIDEVERTLEAAATVPPAPPAPEAVTSALLPPIRIDTAAASALDEQRFEISVREVPAQDFFMGLIEGTDYNMVVHPGVTGTITLNLKNVSVPEVMEVVRDVYGYEFQRQRTGFEVLPARLRTRVYQVDYLNVRRTGSSETRVSSGQVSETAASNGDNTSSTDTTSSSRTTTVTGTEIRTVQPETSYWSELQASITAILGGAEGRSVVVSPQSGVVVVRAMPNELREIEDYLRTTQAIAARQVVLEAKILEVELDDGFRQGIDWQGVFKVDGKQVTLNQLGGGTLVENGTSAINGAQVTLDPGASKALVTAAASAFGGVFAAAIAFSDFNAFIELLDSQGTVHVLSSPRVATVNNQKAVIKVGSDEFFVTDISSTTTTGSSTTTTPSVELTPFFSGVALDVTPQIGADGAVMLHVHPTISEVRDQQKTLTIGTVTQVLPLALSTVRESDTVVRARSGQVVVIGGLMQTRYQRDRADTPMSATPLVGSLFTQRRELASKIELVILLKPIVVDSGREWGALIRGSAERVRSIRGQMRRTDQVGRQPAPGKAHVP